MKTINKYVDEISGKEFAKIEDAIASEKKNGGIKKMFAFWPDVPKDKHCKFSNGHYCYQRKEGDFLNYIDALIKAIKEYEPYIASQYNEGKGPMREDMGAGFMIGRYLCDGQSELNAKYHVLSNICPKCFREWGQPYYATHCTCSEPPKPLTP